MLSHGTTVNSGCIAVLRQYKVQRAQPLQPSHCTNPSLPHRVCWQACLGKLGKKMQIISLHTMERRLMPQIVGEHTLILYFFLGPKSWKASLWLLLIGIVCQSASRSGIQRYELGSPHPAPGRHHKPVVLPGFQAAAGLVAPVHGPSSRSLTDFPA